MIDEVLALSNNALQLEAKSSWVEKEMATHCSILAWKSPWTEESGGLQSMGLHDWGGVHEGGGRWVGSNKLVEIKKKRAAEALPLKHLKISGRVSYIHTKQQRLF